MSNEKELRDGILKSILAAISASAMALITVVGAQVAFDFWPPKIFYILVILLATAPIIVLICMLLPLFSKIINKRIKAWRHNIRSKAFFDEFKGFVNDFENFSDRDKNPVKGIIHNLTMNEYYEEFRKYLSGEYNKGVGLHLQNTFNHFKKRVNKFNGTKEDFLLLVGEFENLLDIYQALFIDKLLQAVKEVGNDKMKEKFKEKYSEFRDSYNDFIRRYKVYGKKVNDKIGEKVVRIDFDIAKEL